MSIITRVTSFASQYWPLTAKGSRLTKPEMDENINSLLLALLDVIPVGVPMPYLGTEIDFSTGFLICDGQTIGKATSDADIANDKLIRLFALLWNSCLSNSTALVVYDNLGDEVDMLTVQLTAQQAWTAEMYITLPDLRGKMIAGLKSDDASFATLFKTGGVKTFDASHTHTNNISLEAVAAHTHAVGTLANSSAGGHTHTVTTSLTTDGDHQHSVPTHTHETTVTLETAGEGAKQVVAFPPAGKYLSAPNSASNTGTTGDHTHTATSEAVAVAAHTHTITGSTATGGGHTHTISGGIEDEEIIVNTLPPYFVSNWIVKFSYGV